jgi:hypothetical protein
VSACNRIYQRPFLWLPQIHWTNAYRFNLLCRRRGLQYDFCKAFLIPTLSVVVMFDIFKGVLQHLFATSGCPNGVYIECLGLGHLEILLERQEYYFQNRGPS